MIRASITACRGGVRDRLLEDGRADRLLALALARLKEVGLVRERTAQRSDSTHVLAAVRDLTRLELVTDRAPVRPPPGPGAGPWVEALR